MRLALITLYTPDFADLARAAVYNKKDYCALHGYEHIVERGLLDPTRPVLWSKPLAILKHLDRFDWVFWSDTDSLILNNAIRLESFCDDQFDMVVTQDMNGLNAGQMIFRNTPRARKFLEEVTRQTQFLDHIWGDQAAIIDLLRRGADVHAKVLPQSGFNSYLSTYQRGDFLLHLAGPIAKRKWLDEFAHRTDLIVRRRDELDALAKRLGVALVQAGGIEDLHVQFEKAAAGTILALEAVKHKTVDEIESFARQKDTNLYVTLDTPPTRYLVKSAPVQHPQGPMVLSALPPNRRAVVVQGWRESTHPYALSGQLVALELMRREDVLVYYQDKGRPQRWQQSDTLFDAESRERLRQVPPPDPEHPADAVLRFRQPFDLTSVPGRRTAVFVEAEMGTVPDAAMERMIPLRDAAARSDALLITPSNWSRQGLINSGAPVERILVVPHGVNTAVFKPLPLEQRAELRTKARAGDDFVFLHVSDLSWTKGLDVLLRAFAAVAQRFGQVRLVLKGMDIPHDSAARLREATMTLSPEQAQLVEPRMRYLGDVARFAKLANLYQIADAYVAPYRAVAFHRPALEAMGCGVPVIATAGGATDDYAVGEFALPVKSAARSMAVDDVADATVLQPDEAHLVEQMCRAIEDEPLRRVAREAGPAAAEQFTWRRVADRLLAAILP